MSNKEFYKKFEQILNEVFGDRPKSMTPLESFFDKIRYDEITDDFGKWKNKIKVSKDGLITTIYYIFHPEDVQEPIEKTETKPYQKDIINLQKELDKCIKDQKFELAVTIRDEIKKLTENKSKISELQQELEKVIQEQNFERAIEIRDELKNIN